MEALNCGAQAIEVQQLTKSFGDHRVLHGVDLKVRAGEAVVIFGPNGAGKTTLVKILATIMNPSSGKVFINGLNLKGNAEEVRRHIGIVTHQTFLYGNLTVCENLEFYSRMYDVTDYKKRIQEVVSVIGMTSRLHDRVCTLSHGMQQRISIARALLHKPSIMLLDEPEAGLDQQARSILWDVLGAEGDRKCTVVMTTHSLERGLELGERLLILARGKIVYQEMAQALDLVSLKEAYRDLTKVKV